MLRSSLVINIYNSMHSKNIKVPYFWAGIKAYDFVSGSECLTSSYFLSRQRALELFPMLKKNDLCGAIVYYDGKICFVIYSIGTI